MTETSLHSRSLLAGYDPATLHAGKVLVVGLGALGQNLTQNLALLGIGQLLLVDFDEFERHNATRSPFYPTRAEAERFGLGKAGVVAHRAAQVSTAQDARVYYSASLIQVLGDAALSWADVVVSAVDSVSARAWLAERSRLLARPMVEGGFSGPHFNLSVFAPTAGSVCYRCGHPGRESSMSCTAYALLAESEHIVPAIQTAAAVLGGYQAEQVVQILHGDKSRFGRRSYGDVRRETLRTASLTPDDDCPGVHQPEEVIGRIRGLSSGAIVQDLLKAISEQFGGGRIWLAEPVIPSLSCTTCRQPCTVQATESSWLANPRCSDCGGPWPIADAYMPDSVTSVDTSDQLSPALANTPLDNLGIRDGASLVVALRDGRAGLLQLDGNILRYVRRATSYEKPALRT